MISTLNLLQVIALSADCQESTKQLCLNVGMDAFLSKPANKTELFNLLEKLASPPPMDMDISSEMQTSP
jgi:CheY-like chemotaxis protein